MYTYGVAITPTFFCLSISVLLFPHSSIPSEMRSWGRLLDHLHKPTDNLSDNIDSPPTMVLAHQLRRLHDCFRDVRHGDIDDWRIRSEMRSWSAQRDSATTCGTCTSVLTSGRITLPSPPFLMPLIALWMTPAALPGRSFSAHPVGSTRPRAPAQWDLLRCSWSPPSKSPPRLGQLRLVDALLRA